MEKITLNHLKWPLTVLFSLLAYIFVNQKDIINKNTIDIKENTHAITVIQGNERASQILISVLDKQNEKTNKNVEKILEEIGELKIAIESNKK